MKEGFQDYEDPIELSEMLEDTVSNLNSQVDTTNLSYNTGNTVSNIQSQILLKKDQLIKMKNEDLNKQVNNLQNYESSIINKDRLIDQTQTHMGYNDTKIRFLIYTLVLIIIGFLLFAIYKSGYIPALVFNILGTILVVIFVLLLFITFNIFYFRTIFVEFWQFRKNDRLLNSVSDWTNFTKTNLQTKLYGNKDDWEDENCDCPPDEEVLPTEGNISVTGKPGLYYYDGNAPKQLVVNNDTVGGEAVDVSASPDNQIFDKIQWVDHDNYTLEEGSYQIKPNDNNRFKNGLLVNNSTYTANL